MVASRLVRRKRRWQWRAFVAGALLVAGAAWTAQQQREFLARAQRFDGVVVDMVGSDRSDPTWTPVVRWHDAQGAHDVRGSWSSDPPAFELGERVGVYAIAGEPATAQLDTTFSLWKWPIILGAIGEPLMLLALVWWWRDWRATRRRAQVRRTGRAVQARYVRVDQLGYVVDGQPARRIIAAWTDPATGVEHEFASEDLGFDPTPWAKRAGELTVFVDPRDPRVHCIDISFLPETLA
jgi:hypothetical protein